MFTSWKSPSDKVIFEQKPELNVGIVIRIPGGCRGEGIIHGQGSAQRTAWLLIAVNEKCGRKCGQGTD